MITLNFINAFVTGVFEGTLLVILALAIVGVTILLLGLIVYGLLYIVIWLISKFK